MYFCSGKPMQFCSGVDTYVQCRLAIDMRKANAEAAAEAAQHQTRTRP